MIVLFYLNLLFVLFEAAESDAWTRGKLKDPGGETFRHLDLPHLHRTVPFPARDQEKFPALIWAASRHLYGTQDGRMKHTPIIASLFLCTSYVIFEAAKSEAWTGGKLKDPGGDTFSHLDLQHLHRTVPFPARDQEKFPALTWAASGPSAPSSHCTQQDNCTQGHLYPRTSVLKDICTQGHRMYPAGHLYLHMMKNSEIDLISCLHALTWTSLANVSIIAGVHSSTLQVLRTPSNVLHLPFPHTTNMPLTLPTSKPCSTLSLRNRQSKRRLLQSKRRSSLLSLLRLLRNSALVCPKFTDRFHGPG